MQSCLKFRDCLIELAAGQVPNSQVEVRFRIFRIELDCFLKMRHRFLNFLLTSQCGPQIILRRRIRWRNADCFFQVCDRFFKLALRSQKVPKIIVRFTILRVNAQRLTILLFGRPSVPFPRVGQSKIVMGIFILRIKRDSFLIMLNCSIHIPLFQRFRPLIQMLRCRRGI